MQNWMVMFTFSLFDRKCPFSANLVQKVKIISLSWNLVPALIRIYRIQWRCPPFLFSIRMPFLGKFRPKCQNCQFQVKLDMYTNLNKQNSVMLFTFFIFDQKCSFWGNLVQNVKIAYVDQFEYAEFNDALHVFGLRPEIHFLGQFRPKNQYCQLKVKLGT